MLRLGTPWINVTGLASIDPGPSSSPNTAVVSRRHENILFGGRNDTPACGLGQGSKAAPASWVQLSSIFVKIYKEKGFGAKMSDPVTKAFIHSIGCMFVDDTDLYEFESKLRSALEVYRIAQQAISLWSLLLAASGGAIKAEKSFWAYSTMCVIKVRGKVLR